MPTYDYACPHCGKKFELFQSMLSEPVAPCPKCGKKAKRQISAGTGIIFKGSGFYLTDYKNKESGKKPPTDAMTNKEKGEPEMKSEGSAKSEAASEKSDKKEEKKGNRSSEKSNASISSTSKSNAKKSPPIKKAVSKSKPAPKKSSQR